MTVINGLTLARHFSDCTSVVTNVQTRIQRMAALCRCCWQPQPLGGGLETKDGPGRSAVRVNREVRQIRLAIRRRRQGKVYPGCQGSVWLDRPDGNRSQLKGSNGSISQWCGTLLITRGKPGQAQIAKSTYHVRSVDYQADNKPCRFYSVLRFLLCPDETADLLRHYSGCSAETAVHDQIGPQPCLVDGHPVVAKQTTTNDAALERSTLISIQASVIVRVHM